MSKFSILDHADSEKWQYLAEMENLCSKFPIDCIVSKYLLENDEKMKKCDWDINS